MKLNDCDRELVEFARQIIAIPSPGGGEGEVMKRVAAEMEMIGWKDIRLDRVGNLHGRIGSGKRVLAIDGHADTVAPGERGGWSCDPLKGKEAEGWIWGRGAVDQKGGLAAAVHAGRIFKEGGGAEDITLRLVVSVQEEDCEGLAWDYLLDREGFLPEAVVLTEPTDLKITRGQLGHCEFAVTVRGRSAHAFCPEKGVNAIYRAAGLIEKIREISPRLAAHPAFGRGRIAVTKIEGRGPSDNSVPDFCRFLIDRRFCPGEDEQSLLAEIHHLSTGLECDISIPAYRQVSHAGTVLEGKKYFPGWLLEEDAPLLRAARATAVRAAVGTWGFSTNGTSTMGRHRIPTIGFGPGAESLAHQPDERVPIAHLLAARDFYGNLPREYARLIGENGE